MVKNLPAIWETWFRSLGQKYPLEKGMATHSSMLAWRFPWSEEPGGLQSMGLQKVRHDRATNTHIQWHTSMLWKRVTEFQTNAYLEESLLSANLHFTSKHTIF